MQVSGGGTLVDFDYSAAGRITNRDDVGDFTYGAGSAGPFAVTSANGLNYGYDANGRMTTRGSDDITWYSYDLPKKIELTSGSVTKTTEFWYGPDRARYQQELATGGTPDAVITYAGVLFEFEDAATDTYRHYVHSGANVIALVERVGSTNTKQFLHRDHQGSVVKVTNASGTVDQALAFDAWGLRRNAADWSPLGSPFAGSHETERGYTGHEHLDTVGLIHMNGRVQDPILGRFISADPLIQSPYNTQSHNRYSYVWNNPASLTDPSGFCAEADGWKDCPLETMVVTGSCDGMCLFWRAWDQRRGPVNGEDYWAWIDRFFNSVGGAGPRMTESSNGGGVPNSSGFMGQEPTDSTGPSNSNDECINGSVQLCSAPAEIAAGLIDHYWIKTENIEAGMGTGNVENIGNEYEALYISKVYVTDHSGQSENRAGASCRTISNVCVNRVEEALTIGEPLGRFSAFNTCKDFCNLVLRQGRDPSAPPFSYGDTRNVLIYDDYVNQASEGFRENRERGGNIWYR